MIIAAGIQLNLFFTFVVPNIKFELFAMKYNKEQNLVHWYTIVSNDHTLMYVSAAWKPLIFLKPQPICFY